MLFKLLTCIVVPVGVGVFTLALIHLNKDLLKSWLKRNKQPTDLVHEPDPIKPVLPGEFVGQRDNFLHFDEENGRWLSEDDVRALHIGWSDRLDRILYKIEQEKNAQKTRVSKPKKKKTKKKSKKK